MGGVLPKYRQLRIAEELMEWLLPKYTKVNDKTVDIHAGNIFHNKFLLIEKRYSINLIKNLEKKFK